MPAGAAEDAFQLIDDALVAAHRAIQALQVAVDDKDQVVEFFPGSDAESAEGIHLVGLAIPDERPDLAVSFLDQAAVLEVAHEARLVDRVERADAHGNGGKAPEIRHQPGMGIGRQPRLSPQFVAEVQQALVIKPSFEVSARIDTWRSVALKVDKVARLISVGGVEEMLVAHFQQGGQRGVGGEMATDAASFLFWPCTMAIAFQRIRASSRSSSLRSPG